MEMSADGSFALISTGMANKVSRIRTVDNAVTATIPLDRYGWANGVAISPDGSFAYVTGGCFYCLVSRIRTADIKVTATVQAADNDDPDVEISPDGSFAYVANRVTDTVSRILVPPTIR